MKHFLLVVTLLTMGFLQSGGSAFAQSPAQSVPQTVRPVTVQVPAQCRAAVVCPRPAVKRRRAARPHVPVTVVDQRVQVSRSRCPGFQSQGVVYHGENLGLGGLVDGVGGSVGMGHLSHTQSGGTNFVGCP